MTTSTTPAAPATPVYTAETLAAQLATATPHKKLQLITLAQATPALAATISPNTVRDTVREAIGTASFTGKSLAAAMLALANNRDYRFALREAVLQGTEKLAHGPYAASLQDVVNAVRPSPALAHDLASLPAMRELTTFELALKPSALPGAPVRESLLLRAAPDGRRIVAKRAAGDSLAAELANNLMENPRYSRNEAVPAVFEAVARLKQGQRDPALVRAATTELAQMGRAYHARYRDRLSAPAADRIWAVIR